ncbi:MAG TPA: hypothetical protein VIC56_03100 [Gemmatimonadota bacterium]|jgi:hypothetical protein
MTYEMHKDEIVLHLTWDEVEKLPATLPIRWKIGVGYVMPPSGALLARVRRALAQPFKPSAAA